MIIDVKPKDLGLPTEAYISVEEVHDVSVHPVRGHSHGWGHLGCHSWLSLVAVTRGCHWLQVLPAVPSHCGPALSSSTPHRAPCRQTTPSSESL